MMGGFNFTMMIVMEDGVSASSRVAETVSGNGGEKNENKRERSLNLLLPPFVWGLC